MKHRYNLPVIARLLPVCLFTAAVLTDFVDAAESPPVPPDLTQNPKIDRKETYNLGATGLRGGIHTKPAADTVRSSAGE
jgi:hypothetical protein